MIAQKCCAVLIIIALPTVLSACQTARTANPVLPPEYLLTQPTPPRSFGEPETTALICQGTRRTELFLRVELDFRNRSARSFISIAPAADGALSHLTVTDRYYNIDRWNGESIVFVVIDRHTGNAALGTMRANEQDRFVWPMICRQGGARL